jgi:hypothetical protein
MPTPLRERERERERHRERELMVFSKLNIRPEDNYKTLPKEWKSCLWAVGRFDATPHCLQHHLK